VETVLGLFELVFFISFVIGLAAGVTWIVVKLSPSPGKKKTKPSAAES
jgi:hypothetical protein